MSFLSTKTMVLNRGVPSDSFLTQLIAWGKSAADEIFAPNDNPLDVYAIIAPTLGPWTGLPHRRAAMLETMRVHAGFESSWNWKEGVDVSNATSMAHITGQETGIFQVSFDSVWLGNKAMEPFAKAHNIDEPHAFIAAMKQDHPLAMEYYARLVRVNIKWAGPLVRHEIDQWLSKSAVTEFEKLLS